MSFLQKRHAFTLIELLTVIAIIGILAAILIPVVGQVRESARQSLCLSNVRQIGLGLITYATENGKFPSLASNANPDLQNDWIHWRRGHDPRNSAIAPYVGGTIDEGLLRCPNDVDYLQREYRYSYAMNSFLGANMRSVFPSATMTIGGRLELIPDPSRIILLAEEDAPDDGHFAYTSNQIAERHNQKGSVTFVDGSARLMTRAELLDARSNRDPSRFDPLYTGN